MRYKYEWQAEYVPEKPIYQAEAEFKSEEALKEHLEHIGGKLIRIINSDQESHADSNPHNILIAHAAKINAEVPIKDKIQEAFVAVINSLKRMYFLRLTSKVMMWLGLLGAYIALSHDPYTDSNIAGFLECIGLGGMALWGWLDYIALLMPNKYLNESAPYLIELMKKYPKEFAEVKSTIKETERIKKAVNFIWKNGKTTIDYVIYKYSDIDRANIEKIGDIALVAASAVIANGIANKLTDSGCKFKVYEEPVKSKFLPW